MIHYFDRSRIETDYRCPRRLYWEYYYDGKGLQPVKLNQHLAFGGVVHEALQCIMEYCQELDTLPTVPEVKEWIDQAAGMLRDEFTVARGFQAEPILEEGFDGTLVQVTDDQSWLLDHYCDLLEGLVVGWCLVRLPALLEQYRVVEVETEEQLLIHTWNTGLRSNEHDGLVVDTSQLIFLSRPDAILERRTDGALVILSFKTVSQVVSMWLENFKTDQQTISEVLPVEARLGREVAGVQIEGLVKGAQRTEWPKGSGHRYHSSPLVWGYLKEEGGLAADWKAQFEWQDEAGNNRRLGKGWNRQRIAESYPGRIAEWLGYLYQNEPELLRAQFISPPLITRSAQELEEWQEQVKYREVDVHNALVQMNAEPKLGIDGSVLAKERLLAQVFPKHTLGCAYDPQFHSKCPQYENCWGSTGADPIGSGLYKYRVPNHPSENKQ